MPVAGVCDAGHKHRTLDGRVQAVPGEDVWLVGEQRSTEEQNYYVSNLPVEAILKTFAGTIKARWVACSGICFSTSGVLT